MDKKEASEVIFESENKDFFRGYNYANVEFVIWFWDVVNGKRCNGAMKPDFHEIRDWIIKHSELRKEQTLAINTQCLTCRNNIRTNCDTGEDTYNCDGGFSQQNFAPCEGYE